MQVYNPATNTWTLAQTLPIAVNHNAAAVVGGKLYSFGAGVGQTFAYDPNINSWVARATIADFNNDGHPDYVLRNPGTRQTAIWYLNNNAYVSAAFGPTLPAGWSLVGL